MFFVLQVGEITTDLGKHQHMHDRDDLQAEQVICFISLFLAREDADVEPLTRSPDTQKSHSPISEFPLIVFRLK